MTISSVELLAKERDRLLHRAVRVVGLSTMVIAFLALGVPGVVDETNLLAALFLGIIVGVCLFRLGEDHSVLWVLLGMTAGFGIIAVVQLPLGQVRTESLSIALIPFVGGTLASFAIVLGTSIPRIALLIFGFLVSIGLLEFVTNDGLLTFPIFAAVLGWLICGFLGVWVEASMPRAAKRIYSIGRAHRAERHASEIEAQRRQSARLLHDTVLATLTLFAHSGVGVSSEALRIQASEDAQLLRQLRLGTTEESHEAVGTPTQVFDDDSILGTTLESVKQRFSRIGLEVSWHGTGQVLLPSEVLDAFLMALAECLENVRRHAGVTQAHVTITDDESSVRAMVTDSGTGFDVKDIDAARLGLKDSVIARLAEVGGSARLFSAVGAGTTVVLEVPK